MKKLISQILIIAMILGTIGLVPSYAIAYDQSAVIFLSNNEDYWKEANFEPTAYATRAQVASVFANYLSDLNPAYTNIYTDVSESHTYANDIMLATNLGLVSGAGGKFRPDEAISREEFAVILVKAHEIAGEKLLDSNYLTELMIDYDSISSWAKTSVVDALGNGLIVSQDKKLFNPKGAVTLSELATALHNLYIVGDGYRTPYTVRDVTTSDNISADFKLKSFSGWNTVGVSGAGMIAYFDGAPGEIYIKRDKSNMYAINDGYVDSRNNFGEPVCYARITGPDGNVVCYVDMDYLESGVMEKIVNIPEGPAGIYQIQFTHNIINNTIEQQDKFTVGLKNPSSWGIRGEDEIVFVDDSLPTTGYIYIPEKVNHLSIGIAATSGNDTIKLYNESNTLLGEVACRAASWLHYPSRMHFSDNVSKYPGSNDEQKEAVRQTIATKGYHEIVSNGDTTRYYSASKIPAGTVLKYVLPSDYRGRLSITGVTPVIYESKEDALELKSGYIYHTDKYTGNEVLQLAGPLQKRARERMIEIYDEMGGAEGLAVDITDKIPQTTPTSYDNPLAEAQPFSVYCGSIYNLKGTIDVQCLDPANPYFGALINVAAEKGGWTGIKDTDYPEKDWQVGNYVMGHNIGFAGLSLNSELNPYYNDEELIRRAELYALYLITQLSADCMLKTNSTENAAASEDLRGGEQFFMGDGAGGYATSYYYTRSFFSPETRQITDEGILMIMDKLMNVKGKTPANQNMMTYLATVYTYKWSGADRYHKNLKNQLMGFMHPAVKSSGQSSLGYLTESFGADGASYGKMSEEIWHNTVHAYLSLPDSMKDPELVAKIYEAEELYLTWDSYFITPSNENFLAVHPANWTSRVNTGLGAHSMRGENGIVKNYFPRAKKNWLVLTLGNSYGDYEDGKKVNAGADRFLPHGEGFGAASNAFILTNNTWATSYINARLANKNRIYNAYHSDEDPTAYLAEHSEMYYVHHQEQQFSDSEMPKLPYETDGDYNFFLNENGIVTVKHKGLYMICYFNNAQPDDIMAYHSWIGGGPTSIWDNYFTTTLNALKPGTIVKGVDKKGNVIYTETEKSSGFLTYSNNYSNKEYDIYNYVADDFRHSCIVGTDENGRLFVSGREKPTFSWNEYEKSFRISGTQATTKPKLNEKGEQVYDENKKPVMVTRSKDIVWDYTLTDSGIEIKGGVGTYKTGQTLYMQLPIYVPSGAEYDLDEDNKKIVISHNNNSITYDWNSSNYMIREIVDKSGTYKYLKILLTPSAPQAAVTISRNLAS